ncbi:MAG TPA: ATP-binding protein [Thermoanaerobaculia bacterium]|nr:ATP-binding protein [Thermoanaerobaculia bacterium]
MIAPSQEIYSVLRQYNPWWESGAIRDLPGWRRTAFSELLLWLAEPPAPRAILLSGARQVGKTTLLLQAVEELLARGVRPERILYATFDHPLLKLIGLEGVLNVWREIQPRSEETEYILLDEIQYTQSWQTWLKHQVDFEKRARIAVTGSAVPLETESLESGVGRWHTIRLATLSFSEYLQIQEIRLPNLPEVDSLAEIFSWSPADLIRAGETARPLVAHFHEYLLRGGFPQTALIESVTLAQKLLREDIVDKVLKRDMTALFGVRRVLELERTFLYLCLHDGGLLDIQALCTQLGLKKPTVSRFIDLLEAAHLVYRLPPYGYGKEILRGKFKVYLADPAIAGSVLLKGRSLLDDEIRLGAAAETAFFKHVYARYYQTGVSFTYWRGRKSLEVDILADVNLRLIPFEVKYSLSPVQESDLKGLRLLCEEKEIPRGYVITRQISDFGVATLPGKVEAAILKIPAPLACYWLSRSEGRS